MPAYLAEMSIAHSGVEMYFVVAKFLLDGIDKNARFLIVDMSGAVVLHPAIAD